jgi:hypothetical protein
MPRAIVFRGDETWELREVPKPKLRPGCAVAGGCLMNAALGLGGVTPWHEHRKE